MLAATFDVALLLRSGRLFPVHGPVVRAGDILPRRVAGGPRLRRHAAGERFGLGFVAGSGF